MELKTNFCSNSLEHFPPLPPKLDMTGSERSSTRIRMIFPYALLYRSTQLYTSDRTYLEENAISV
jgi:hypothetical protein